MGYWDQVLNERVSRRRGLALLGGTAAGAALLAACGGGSDDKSSSDQASNTPKDGPVKKGGTLRLGLSTDLYTIDPQPRANGFNALWEVVEGLITYDDKVQPQALLAESWEQTDGGLKTVMHLRKGVKWHNGREFTSTDVKANIDRAKDPASPLGNYRPLANWFTVEMPDPQTVVLKSDSPRSAMWDFFVQFHMVDVATAGQPQVIGTGPWKFVEWKQSLSLKYVKNPEYWQKDMPNLDGIQWNMPVEAQAALAQFEAGALDLVVNPAVTGFVRYQKDTKLQTYIDPSPGSINAMGFNTKDKPFDDKRVRQAFNWSIDRQRLVDTVLKGIPEPRSLPWPKNSPAFDEAKNNFYKIDLKKAADLLRAAGATDVSTNVIPVSGGGTEFADYLPIWQEDLKTIGVKLQITPVDSAGFPAIVNGLQHHSLWAASTGSTNGQPISMFVIASTAWGGDGKNNTGYENPAYQDLINKGATELDAKKLRTIYDQLNDMVLDSSNVMPLTSKPSRFVAVANLKKVTRTPYDSFGYTEAWLA